MVPFFRRYTGTVNERTGIGCATFHLWAHLQRLSSAHGQLHYWQCVALLGQHDCNPLSYIPSQFPGCSPQSFPLDLHHGRASSQRLLIPPIHRNIVLNSNLNQATPSQVYSKVDASIAPQLHAKAPVKAQEDNSGYLDRSFHCMMTS